MTSRLVQTPTSCYHSMPDTRLYSRISQSFISLYLFQLLGLRRVCPIGHLSCQIIWVVFLPVFHFSYLYHRQYYLISKLQRPLECFLP
ncbi:hypothetical protein EV702DRAFT_550476 [Suillus placidus]|uniref:Uncharacterized protein n=1 Tax=Suillus placidus TaxID=48579 RepID=A0A9P7D0N0_9AGAM|nr:hypothetical protein EV702DRAFT_550476 [Suillus placidus]